MGHGGTWWDTAMSHNEGHLEIQYPGKARRIVESPTLLALWHLVW